MHGEHRAQRLVTHREAHARHDRYRDSDSADPRGGGALAEGLELGAVEDVANIDDLRSRPRDVAQRQGEQRHLAALGIQDLRPSGRDRFGRGSAGRKLCGVLGERSRCRQRPTRRAILPLVVDDLGEIPREYEKRPHVDVCVIGGDHDRRVGPATGFDEAQPVGGGGEGPASVVEHFAQHFACQPLGRCRMRHPPSDAQSRRSYPHGSDIVPIEHGTEGAVPVDDGGPRVSDLVGGCRCAEAKRDRHP